MDNQQTTTEVLVSRTKIEIIREAKRMEEALLISSKKHFISCDGWSQFHILLGIPMVLLSAIAGASAFAQFDQSHVVAGVLSIIVAALSALMTFLNPNSKSSAHSTAGNGYDALMNKVRIFWSIDCWQGQSEEVLTEKLKYFSEQKDRLNQSAPSPLWYAYERAKKGIEAGEGTYAVDQPQALPTTDPK